MGATNHYVICPYCSQRFNRDKVLFVLVGTRRYAHKECAEKYEEKLSKDEKDKKELEDYILKLFNISTITSHIQKQIKDYIQNKHYTYSGILKTLKWFYEVKGNTTEKSNGGIGIVPFIYDECYDYYYNLYLANTTNKQEDIQKFIELKAKTIFITSPRANTKKPKLFNLEEEEVN